MGGIELARLLKRKMPDMPVILASGYSHALAQEGTGGFELIRKPYSADEVTRILGQAVRTRPRRTADGSSTSVTR